MSRSRGDLCPRVRHRVDEALSRMLFAGIAVMVIDTLRTPAEQAANVAKGVSWTPNSLHLAQKGCPACASLGGLAHAIDVAPYAQFQLHGPDKLQWDAADPAWAVIGECGEMAGLTWGGRWRQKDLGHFEWRGQRAE